MQDTFETLEDSRDNETVTTEVETLSDVSSVVKDDEDGNIVKTTLDL